MICLLFHEAHVKEVGLIQNWETITLETLTTIDLLYLLCKRAHMSRMVMGVCAKN